MFINRLIFRISPDVVASGSPRMHGIPIQSSVLTTIARSSRKYPYRIHGQCAIGPLWLAFFLEVGIALVDDGRPPSGNTLRDVERLDPPIASGVG